MAAEASARAAGWAPICCVTQARERETVVTNRSAQILQGLVLLRSCGGVMNAMQLARLQVRDAVPGAAADVNSEHRCSHRSAERRCEKVKAVG